MPKDATVRRGLLASLHQAIAEVIPARLEFYEQWWSPPGTDPQMFEIPGLTALLTSLHAEGEAWPMVAASAGRHAASRGFKRVPVLTRTGLRLLPRRIRAAAAIRLAAAMLQELYPGMSVDMTRRGATFFINIDESPFCGPGLAVPSEDSTCGFHAAAIKEFLRSFKLQAPVKVSRCRTAGSKSCLLMVLPNQARLEAQTEPGPIGPGLHLVLTEPGPISPGPHLAPTEPGPVGPGLLHMEIGPGAPLASPVEAPVAPDDRDAIEARWDQL